MFYKRLKKNFFLKLKDMEKITKQTWEKYDLPENLFELLMDKYNEIKAASQPDLNSKSNLASQYSSAKVQTIPSEEITENKNQRKNLIIFHKSYKNINFIDYLVIDMNPQNLMNNINTLLNKNSNFKTI